MPNSEETTAVETPEDDKKTASKRTEFRELGARLKELREVTKSMANRRKELEARHSALGTELGRPARQKKA